METQTQTQTVTVMVVRPNASPEELTVAAGSTVADIATQLGLPDGANLPALNVNTGDVIRPEGQITEDAVLSYAYKLAGA